MDPKVSNINVVTGALYFELCKFSLAIHVGYLICADRLLMGIQNIIKLFIPFTPKEDERNFPLHLFFLLYM